MPFRLDDMQKYFTEEELGDEYVNADKCIDELVNEHSGIVAFIPDAFINDKFTGKKLQEHQISFQEVFFGNEWFPTATPAAQFGFVPLVLGTVWVTVFAILFALPFGLSVAIYIVAWRHSVGCIRFLRTYRDSTVAARRLWIACRRERFGGRIGACHHGVAYHHNSEPRRHAELSALTARSKPRLGSVKMADNIQGRNAILHIRNNLSDSAWHRPCLRRNDGRANGYGKRGCDTALDNRPSAHYPSHNRSRTRRSPGRRTSLSVIVPLGRGAVLHHTDNQLKRGIHISQEQEISCLHYKNI